MTHINKKSWLVLSAALAFVLSAAAQQQDEYLTALYDKLNWSPMQEKFRQLAPMPYGVVFCLGRLYGTGYAKAFPPHEKLGFTNLKQTMATPEWPEQETLRIALEEGIIPFWYGEGGWEPITPALLEKLGIPAQLSMAAMRTHPKCWNTSRKCCRNNWLHGTRQNANLPSGMSTTRMLFSGPPIRLYSAAG